MERLVDLFGNPPGGSRPREQFVVLEARKKVGEGGIEKKKKPSARAKSMTKDQRRRTTKAKSKSRKEVSKAAMFKHMTVAIYKSILDRDYSVRGSPEQAAQAIARGRMVKWHYARRKKAAGGVSDRLAITLTGKGKSRSKLHSREPSRVIKRKDKQFQRIVGAT